MFCQKSVCSTLVFILIILNVTSPRFTNKIFCSIFILYSLNYFLFSLNCPFFKWRYLELRDGMDTESRHSRLSGKTWVEKQDRTYQGARKKRTYKLTYWVWVGGLTYNLICVRWDIYKYINILTHEGKRTGKYQLAYEVSRLM